MEKFVALYLHAFHGHQRAVGPFDTKQECVDWIERQDDELDLWRVAPFEHADTLNYWEGVLRMEGTIIYDFDGFTDWRQEWKMTRAEFDVRVGKCTVGPASAVEP